MGRSGVEQRPYRHVRRHGPDRRWLVYGQGRRRAARALGQAMPRLVRRWGSDRFRFSPWWRPLASSPSPLQAQRLGADFLGLRGLWLYSRTSLTSWTTVFWGSVGVSVRQARSI